MAITASDTEIDVTHKKLDIEHYMYFNELKKTLQINDNDWKMFSNTWNNLHLDHYMAKDNQCRYRRYAVFSWDRQGQQIELEERQPHFQDLDSNYLYGGLERYYQPCTFQTLHNSAFGAILDFVTKKVSELTDSQSLHIEVHQFRIVASNNKSGSPTPEGIHRDGRHYVFIMLVNKINIEGGITTLYNQKKNKLQTLTLDIPSEALFLDDMQLMHRVSDILPLNKKMSGFRDTLVITYYIKNGLSPLECFRQQQKECTN